MSIVMLDDVAEWFRALNARTGVDFSIFYDPFDASRFVHGVVTTVELSTACVVLSVVVGVIVAAMRRSRHVWVTGPINGYVQFFRNTPSIVQLYFFYFGLGPLFTRKSEFGQSVPLVGGFTWAVVCLSIYGGALNAEAFRAGIAAIHRSTVEAAEALGYSRLRTYVHVILPLAVRFSFPVLRSNLVNLIKTTSVAYAISVPETLYVSSQIWSDRLNVVEMMNVVLATYVGLTGAFSFAMGRLERRMRIPGVGHGQG